MKADTIAISYTSSPSPGGAQQKAESLSRGDRMCDNNRQNEGSNPMGEATH